MVYFYFLKFLLLVCAWLRHPGTRVILPWATARQMAPFYELRVIHHPETSKVVFIADKALVQRQVRADCVLQGARKKRKRGKLDVRRKVLSL